MNQSQCLKKSQRQFRFLCRLKRSFRNPSKKTGAQNKISRHVKLGFESRSRSKGQGCRKSDGYCSEGTDFAQVLNSFHTELDDGSGSANTKACAEGVSPRNRCRSSRCLDFIGPTTMVDSETYLHRYQRYTETYSPPSKCKGHLQLWYIHVLGTALLDAELQASWLQSPLSHIQAAV